MPEFPRLQDVLQGPSPQPVEAHPDDAAMIAFTSGSTGPAKGVELTYRNLQGIFAAFRTLLGEQQPGSVDMIRSADPVAGERGPGALLPHPKYRFCPSGQDEGRPQGKVPHRPAP